MEMTNVKLRHGLDIFSVARERSALKNSKLHLYLAVKIILELKGVTGLKQSIHKH